MSRGLGDVYKRQRLSAITPNDGDITATINAATDTEIENIASAVHSLPKILVVNPFALRNRNVNQPGKIAVVTDVSNALFPQS